MISATKENWDYARERNITLREACFANAIVKLAKRFEESGMMMN